ncbi:MAG: PLP-dependent transferase [Planctomycetia bacterium]|jgi:cystathionine beta-lyase/cystathionine gamma-synthase|nr:PLP-dependent transferase [Planctomycetia bacterium]MCC7315622.1 PLP-dependent transferase [Planctomycetota bacterium]OQY97426.1 MAG: cystathionine gamma-lyase [Planctomycetes bacterium UTPLA1]
MMKEEFGHTNEPDAKSYPLESDRAVRTRLIHGIGRSRKWDYDHHVVPPMTSSATFRLDSASRGAQGFVEFGHLSPDSKERGPIYIYDRLDEPTRGMLEENLAVAERAECAVCFATGMAAISAALGILAPAGAHILSHRTIYGCTYSLMTNWLPRINVETSFADFVDPQSIANNIRENTRILYFETPVNPDMQLIDIAAARRTLDEINRHRPAEHRVWMVVDNTFASPFCQRPVTLGADVVVESLTKAIGGFGTDLGGVVAGPKSLHDSLVMYRKDFGASLSPKSAWPPLVYGLPSLAARMANYQKTAHHIARFLENHPKVEYVRYPGLANFPQFELAKKQMVDEGGHFAPGSMIYFVLRRKSDNDNPGERLIDWIAANSYCITLAVSLGQIKTLIECPYSMTHAALPPQRKAEHGLVPGGVRLSVGLEDWHDLMSELSEALDHI